MKRPNPKDIAKAYADLLEIPAGRIVLRDLLDATGVWRGGFNADAHVTYFREGERNIGLRILARLAKSSPEKMQALLGSSYEQPEPEKQDDEAEPNQPGTNGADRG